MFKSRKPWLGTERASWGGIVLRSVEIARGSLGRCFKLYGGRYFRLCIYEKLQSHLLGNLLHSVCLTIREGLHRANCFAQFYSSRSSPTPDYRKLLVALPVREITIFVRFRSTTLPCCLFLFVSIVTREKSIYNCVKDFTSSNRSVVRITASHLSNTK